MGEQIYTIRLEEAIGRNPQVRLARPVSLELGVGEHVAIAGPNGAGKSLLVDLLTGRQPLAAGKAYYDFRPNSTRTIYNNVKYIAFRDTYGSADANYYYQQRWNAHDQDGIPLVGELLRVDAYPEAENSLLDLFQLRPLLNKPIILLSSGELRKFQLARALLTSPRVLILDNPFIGLDASARSLLVNLLTEVGRMGELQLVLVVSRPEDIPPFITHVIPVHDKIVERKELREDFLSTSQSVWKVSTLAPEKRIAILENRFPVDESDEVVRLAHVNIRYGDRIILRNLDWTVRRGEHWALSGENGAGKSTLLSLVCADNPQSYACNIRLFGQRRGSGESIWEIKQRIGYVSPEMHRAYLKNLPALDIVASGLTDSIGLYRRPKEEDLDVCFWWMKTLGVENLATRPFLTLSSGEQRLCLLARAFVKDPELLVLDEPLHGLDAANRALVRCIIDVFSRRPGKTLLMVTHYEEELPSCIDHRLHLMRQY